MIRKMMDRGPDRSETFNEVKNFINQMIETNKHGNNKLDLLIIRERS